MDRQKRVLAIHDISCVGRCSLTVALPVLSACGVECSLLPTALLSTHTGGFSGYTFLDLSDEMEKVLDHWKTLDMDFDYIYTGYLGSPEQIKTVARTVAMYPSAKLIVDTVMGDGGRMYQGLSDDFPEAMRSLTTLADMITPNATEAALLLGEDYRGEPWDCPEVRDTVARLAGDTAGGAAVMTGVVRDGEIGAVACVGGKFYEAFSKKADGMFHGTGDVFASALVAALAAGADHARALFVAAEFTHRAIEASLMENRDRKYGVPFEKALPFIVKELNGSDE